MVPKSQEKRKIEEGMKEEVERMRPFCLGIGTLFWVHLCPLRFWCFQASDGG